MEKSHSTIEQLELKYCERCGALWLRHKGAECVYCADCVSQMNEMPQPRRSAPRLQVPPIDLDGRRFDLCGVVAGGRL